MQLSTKSLRSVNIKSFFVAFVIALGVIAFAVTGIGFRTGGVDANVAAKVGSQNVSMRTFSEVFSQLNTQAGENLDESRRAANAQQALNQLIQEKLFIEEAYRIGWRPTDLEVAMWIHQKVPAFQNETTKQFDKSLYQKFIRSGQMSELELYDRGREAIAQERIYNLLQLQAYTPTNLIKDKIARNSVEFQLEMLELQPPESAVKALVAEEAKTFANDAANEKVLKEAYETSKADFQKKAAQRVSSILISYKDAQRAEGAALNRTEEEAKKLADETRLKLANGAAMATFSAINDDSKAKAAGGDLGFIDENSIDSESYKIAEALTAKNKLSPVVKTPFGYRILLWTGSRPAVNRPYESVKVELAERHVSANARLKLAQEIKNTLTSALAENNMTKFNDAVAKYQLTWKKVNKPISAETRYNEDIGFTENVVAQAFQLKQPGAMTKEPIDVGGKSMLFKLISRTEGSAADDKKIAEVRRTEEMRSLQSLASNAQKTLLDKYERNNEIKRNPAIMAAR